MVDEINLKELKIHMDCLRVFIHHCKQCGFDAEVKQNELDFCQKFINKKISKDTFINKIKNIVKKNE